MVRRVREDELAELLRLYLLFQPNEQGADPRAEPTRTLWRKIQGDENLHYYGYECDDRLASTCTLTIIPNLNHNLRPYGLIENVVTDPAHRRRGFATLVLRHAVREAWELGCYKVMLLTGSKQESTLRFYEQAGFQRGVKTGFIAYPE